MSAEETIASAEFANHLRQLAVEFPSGHVIPFLGAGVNLCGFPRPSADGKLDGLWWKTAGVLPNGSELARHLAQRFQYPDAETNWDLMRVSQFADVMEGTGPLYEELQRLFAREYSPNALHKLLARIPAMLAGKGFAGGLPLVVTTNYDEVLETAFDAENLPFDIVCYMNERGEHRGKFWHLANAHAHFKSARDANAASGMDAAPWQVIASPNTYTELPIGRRTIIFKIHGAVDHTSAEASSFVITEDDYIDYLARMDFTNPLPKMLAAHMKCSRFLFLGYGLRDWNLRVVLQRIWGERKLTYRSWAIQFGAQDLDRKSWQKRNVDIFDLKLEDYVPALERTIEAIASAPSK